MENTTILVVDDEEIIAESLSFDLKKKGYKVTVASSGEEAVKKLEETDFDIIITDLIMGKLNGLGVLEKAKAKHTGAKVIIITGYASVDTAIKAVRLGADDYIQKPYNKGEMFLRVNKCVKQLELERKVKLYEDILPVCCKCRKIRDDTGVEHGNGEWMAMEAYLKKKTKVRVSHTFCKKCAEDTYPKLRGQVI
ncbi:MAG: response regulator [Candidatus Anammoxibacter sp.]